MHPLHELADRLHRARRVAIAAHVRPDGDAIGSVLGLALSLRAAGKIALPLLEDPVPENLAFLPHSADITPPPEALEADLVVALDTATRDRLGPRCVAAFEQVADWINLDHHGTNPGYGTLNHIDPAVPATGQLVYELLQTGGFPIDDAVRQNLYVAISTDTGSFQYPSTTARTHQIAAEMLAAGLDSGRLCRLTYETFPARRLHLMRALLNEMRLSAGGRVASWIYHRRTAQEANAQPGDTEGLIDLLRMVDSVIAAVIFEELEEGRVRVSARSKDTRLNVAEVCGRFGGGGHHLAAGARMKGSVEAASQQFLQVLEDEVRRLD